MNYHPLQDLRARTEEIRETLTNDEERAIYDKTMASISPERVTALQEKYADQLVDFDPIGIYKYADLPFWIARNVALVRRIGLDKEPPLRLLDIGMGAGHFAAVAQGLGHSVVGTDIAVPLYDDLAIALDLDRRIVPVRANEPYPYVGGPFDRVTIVWQVFDYIRSHPDGSRDYWPVENWKFLLEDLARNHTSPDAIIHLELNPHIQKNDSYYDQALLDFCAEHGGDMTKADLGIVELPAANLR